MNVYLFSLLTFPFLVLRRRNLLILRISFFLILRKFPFLLIEASSRLLGLNQPKLALYWLFLLYLILFDAVIAWGLERISYDLIGYGVLFFVRSRESFFCRKNAFSLLIVTIAGVGVLGFLIVLWAAWHLVLNLVYKSEIEYLLIWLLILMN